MVITHGLQDGQVLQRQRGDVATVRVQGTCVSAGRVTASLAFRGRPVAGWSRRLVGRAARGRFKVRLAGIPVGGPYAISLGVCTETVTAVRIYVGDVWVLAGQSNMQGPGLITEAPAPHPLVHALYMDRRWAMAREPLHNFLDAVDPVHRALNLSPADRRYASAIGVGPAMTFGRDMVRRSGGVPQGLIATAQGASSMAMWDPAKKTLGGASLYGSFLRAVRHTGQPIAGILWYQGEADAIEGATSAQRYTARMRRLIAAFRRDLGQPRLPVIMVQIGRHFRSPADAAPWNSIQEQQRRLPRRVPHLACVAAVDLEMGNFIHLSSAGEQRLGRRLARLADRLVYGNRREPPPPELASVAIVPTAVSRVMDAMRVVVTFRHVAGGLRAAGAPTGFSLVDANGHSHNVFQSTRLSGNRVILEATQKLDPATHALMYGYGRSPYVNITDARDLPLPVFGPIPLAPRR
ncbi:MAG: sialate O-acetylesterase [Lentisphaerae bacterium]|nr:sialate O-acetylesterase [Lentisphaerota bacterium]